MNVSSCLQKNELSKEEIVFLLNLEVEKDIQQLYKKADLVRQKYCGKDVHLRGIIEISNYCEQDCLYCGLRNANTSIQRYRMRPEEIITTASFIQDAGVNTIVLQSGEDNHFTGDMLAELIHQIKIKTGCAITLSLGERTFDEYEKWKQAGADRYLLKHETANPKLYSMYHQNQSLHERVKHLKHLREIGFQIGSGNLIGLPHQTVEDIADDLILCKELEVDMVSISPFIASPDTPYKDKPGATVKAALKAMAVSRIILKDSHMPATTALSTLDEQGRQKGLRVGANVIMPNFTPEIYRQKYLIYPNKDRHEYSILPRVNLIKGMILSMGRTIGIGPGHSFKMYNE